MKRLAIIILCKCVGFSVNRKFSVGNTVAVSSYDASKIWIAILQIATQRIKTQYHVAAGLAFIEGNNIGYGGAIVDQLYDHTTGIGKCILRDNSVTDLSVFSLCQS